MFQCALTHKCLPSSRLCDGENDCGAADGIQDFSDETDVTCEKFIYLFI